MIIPAARRPGKGDPVSVEEWAQGICSTVEEECADFIDPDADWPPMLFLQESDGAATIYHLGSLFQDEDGKEFFAHVFAPELILQLRAITFGFMISTWQVAVEGAKSPEGGAEETPREGTT